VERAHERADARVHDRLADERERAVPHARRLGEPLGQRAGQSVHRLDHGDVLREHLGDEVLGLILLPAPLAADRVFVVAPAEDALVRARERRRRLHALVR
jgi:hypothetical protein